MLTPAEGAALDAFGAAQRPSPALPDLAHFLRERFGVDLVLDPDIVAGFERDSSNLPGRAAGLCRPRQARECAVIARACFAAGVPYTLSAGRSNLTGSATPVPAGRPTRPA